MLRVNVADTPLKQEKGLMFVKDLPNDHGMLFQFSSPRKMSFWGLNTYIPLDIAFVDEKNKIVDIQEIHPHDHRSVSCKSDCLMAIEANIDYFKDNNIRVGDVIQLIEDSFEGPSVKFLTHEKINKKAQKSKTEEITLDQAEKLNFNNSDISMKNNEENVDLNFNKEEELPQNNSNFEENEIISQQNLPEYTIEDIQFAEDTDEESFDPYMEIEKGNKPEPSSLNFPDFQNTVDAIVWADRNGQTVWIEYNTRSGRQIQRNIEPHGIFMAKGTGNLIVVAFDETVNDIRAFIVNKIKDFQFLGRTFNKKFIFSPR